MSTWYKLALGNDDQAFEPTLRIQQMFMSKFLMCPPGSGRALFSCYDKEKDDLVCISLPPLQTLRYVFTQRLVTRRLRWTALAFWPARGMRWASSPKSWREPLDLFGRMTQQQR